MSSFSVHCSRARLSCAAASPRCNLPSALLLLHRFSSWFLGSDSYRQAPHGDASTLRSLSSETQDPYFSLRCPASFSAIRSGTPGSRKNVMGPSLERNYGVPVSRKFHKRNQPASVFFSFTRFLCRALLKAQRQRSEQNTRGLPIGFRPIGFPHHGQNCFAQDARKSEMSGVPKSSSIAPSLTYSKVRTYSKVCRALGGKSVAEIQVKPRQFRALKNRREGACFHVFLRFRYVNLYLPGPALTPGL